MRSVGEPKPIPFNAGQMSGLSELSGAAPAFINFLADAAGAIRVRPGIEPWSDFPDETPNESPVIGMFAWRTYLLYVTQDRKLWAWEATGGVQALSDSTTTTQLDGSLRPVWTCDSTRVVVTGGGAPQTWQGTGLSSRLSPAATTPSGSPLALTHIAYAGQRFIGNTNDNTGYLQWTPPGPGNHTSWPIVGPYYSEAEAAPDPVIALHANSNEVFAFGTETLQVYQPDPVIAFTVSASKQAGCSAPYSVIEVEDEGFAWLDDKRRLVFSNGREVQPLSSPALAADIDRFTVVEDCWGAFLRIGSHELLLWVFPTEKRGPYYDRTTKKWGEFRSIDDNGEWQSWIANCHYYWSDRNLHLIGLSDGTIGVLTFDAFDDNGTTIRAVSRTGFQDHGTFNRKLCERVDVQLKRGDTVPPATPPTVEVRYRDDLGAFQPSLRFSMGAAHYQPVQSAWAQREYRQRQWELEWSGGSEFLLAGASEQIVVGDT